MKIEFIFMKDKSSHGSRDKKGLRDNKQKRHFMCVCLLEYVGEYNIPWEINKT